MSKETIHTDDAPSAIGTYSQAVRSGNFLFMSGQIPLDPASKEVGDGDFDARAHRVFQILNAVDVAGGGNLDQVV